MEYTFAHLSYVTEIYFGNQFICRYIWHNWYNNLKGPLATNKSTIKNRILYCNIFIHLGYTDWPVKIKDSKHFILPKENVPNKRIRTKYLFYIPQTPNIFSILHLVQGNSLHACIELHNITGVGLCLDCTDSIFNLSHQTPREIILTHK